ncbi:MAG: XisI protein [Saprospiraceae bacterium]
MDKIEKYQQIIMAALQRHADIRNNNRHPKQAFVETQLLFDTKHNHFMLMSIGWNAETSKFIYGVAFHIDIKDGKVWVQQDNTDAIIVDDLLEGGILQSDIVLGFLSPYMRQFSDFATV